MLSRLEIFGFKSFAKKLDLRLNGGITAVVGPNGCGKSNIVDAIRWVFGEQRPSHLRSDKMEEVIFSGTPKRRPLGIAEVSITLNNESGILPVDLSEVVVTRRVYRSGESDYFINKRRCRLLDINNLIMNTGIGVDSYSIFERSMIDAIISEKTEERRRIFEEAAGITKYKARRRSTLQKLAQTDNDLSLVDNIIIEVESQVRSLKRQAGRAKTYKELREKIKHSALLIIAHERQDFFKEKNRIETDLIDASKQLDTLTGKIRLNEAELEKKETGILDTQNQLQDVKQKFEMNAHDISEKDKETTRLTERERSLDEMSESFRKRLQETEEKLSLNREQIEKIVLRQKSLEEDLIQITGELDNKRRSVEAFDIAFEKVCAHDKNIEEEVRKLSTELSHKSDRKSFLEERMTKATEHESILRQKENNRKAAIQDIENRLSQIGISQSDLSSYLNEIRIKFNECKEIVEDKEKELQSLREKTKNVEDDFFQCKTERNFLNQVITSLEGYTEGVRASVNDAGLDGGILGVLGNLIEVTESYEQAVEAALEQSLELVIVEDENTSKKAIHYLTETKRGRATFIPVKTTGSEKRPEFIKTDCVLGLASQFVQTEPGLQGLIDKLLGSVLVVESLEDALRLKHEKAFPGNATFVTITGERLGQLGEITGGQENGSKNAEIIGRRKRLDDLEEKLSCLGKELDSLNKQKHQVEVNLTKTKNDLAENNAKITETTAELTSLESQANQYEFEKNILYENGIDLEKQLQNTIDESGEIKESIQLLTNAIESLKGNYEKLRTTLDEGKTRLDKLRARSKEHHEVITGLREKQVHLSAALDACRQEEQTLKENLSSLENSLEILETDREKAVREKKDIGEKLSQLKKQMDQLTQQEELLSKEKDSIEDTYNVRKAEIFDISHKLKEQRQQIGEAQSEVHQKELNLSRVQMEIKNLEEKGLSDFGIDLSTGDSSFPELDESFNLDEEESRLERLKVKLDRMGDINLTAEEQYEKQRERLEFLKRERDDLVQAKETLENTILKINHTARELFLETFEKIRENFQNTFDDLFDGGATQLYLGENEDPLEAPIIINARPKGKHIRSINLLSGGEKALTAVALLFAIYLTKPSPFCILDEVDAPLDDTNIIRFLRLIDNFKGKTQFIIVTHNKKSMEAADVLYGITMAEPGVSTLVSVKLKEEIEEEKSLEMKKQAV